ncbi:peroxiredoxin [Ekhidna sp.]|jgi:peroxiredoxin Q/BCP|uniref:peroxiredoxin n=1 Tax=Ekhidna sp. TaxID=2608089 RepID=UPI0032ED5631
MLHKGEQIPYLRLEDQDGKMVSLSDLVGNPMVIYFYPKDNTAVCTAQACGFRDHYEQFQQAGAEVIGISRDSAESHKHVTNKRNLPFLLLSDSKKEAHKAFKVPSSLFGLLPGRVTFVIDKEGKVAHTFRADFNADKHIKEALKVIKSL